MYTWTIIKPKEMTTDLLLYYESFRFQGLDNTIKAKEIEIDRLYHNRSIFIFCFDDTQIIACARLIAKWSSNDLLPVEYGAVFSGQRRLSEIAVNKLPICEVAGLKIAERGMKDRYEILSTIINECYDQFCKNSFNFAIASCRIGIENLYKKHCNFNEVAVIKYSGRTLYKVLCMER